MKVLLHRTVERYLDRLNKSDRDRFNEAFSDLEKEPPEGDIRPYEGSKDVLRLRVGNYRVIFKYVENKILVTHIEPRGQAYKKKTKSKRG
ncbi:MAG: type II toxin-antitoxin system RelE/ParE family toxin [Treponema sp.]|jgi:mRNA interferase RelE/StbE|nr:type II toxin-antitoxin system RelE/ParE family toxin [Treponema sp.]